MADLPNFGVMVARLLKSRGQDVDHLMRAAGTGEPEFEAVFSGDTPGHLVMRRLAPVLGLHAADLFVLAGLDVPSDLVPFHAPPGRILDDIVKAAVRLPPERRQQLREAAKTTPRQDRVAPPVQERDSFQYGPGAVIVRMLRNRNLSNLNSAKMLYRLAGIGPLSAATIQVVGYGRKELSDELLCGFATVLSFRIEDLAALVNIQLIRASPSADAATHEVAELIWDLRNLSSDQLHSIHDKWTSS